MNSIHSVISYTTSYETLHETSRATGVNTHAKNTHVEIQIGFCIYIWFSYNERNVKINKSLHKKKV